MNDTYSEYCPSRHRGVKILFNTLIFTMQYNNTRNSIKYKEQKAKCPDSNRGISKNKFNSRIQS